MKISLDCIPCFVRQALDAARLASPDPGIHERILREVLLWAAEMDMNQTAPAMGQRIHRRLREIIGSEDPYRVTKDRQNRMALRLFHELKGRVAAAADPLMTAARLAIAGNIIDLGVKGGVKDAEVRASIAEALENSFDGDHEGFRRAVGDARRILYLADNAGEIAFDRLLIEELSPERVTVAVRGAPVINDATRADALAVGLEEIVEVIDNGSDAPGTVLHDCHEAFRRRFAEADLILAKGQGNFETLSEEGHNIFFLFRAKCPVIAAHAGVPLGTHALIPGPGARRNDGKSADGTKGRGDRDHADL